MLRNKFKIRFSIGLLFFGIVLFLSTASVSAHVLKTSGSIGAVLHINPDDDPIIGQLSTFLLEFKDSQGKFNLHNCICNYSISKASLVVSSGNLFPYSDTDHNSASFGYTFPEKGVYQVQISGSSSDNSFSNFSFSYDQRIDREAGTESNFNLLTRGWQFFALLGILIVLVILFIFSRRVKKKVLS